MKTFIQLAIVCLVSQALFSQTTNPILSTPDSWTRVADFGGAAKAYAAGFSIGNKIYIGPGYSGSYDSKDFWEFDPAANTWTRKADFAGDARDQTNGFSVNGKGYVCGGKSYSAPYIYYKDLWEYDPATDTWTMKADFPGTPRAFATAFSIDNKGYFGTGYRYDTGTYGDFWEYDPATDTWSRKADFAGGGRSNPTGFSIGSKGYIGIGWNGGWQADFYQYDPATNTWTRKANFGGGAREWAAGMSIGTKGYIGTGYTGGYYKDFWEYDPNADTWTRKADFPGFARNGALGFSIGDKGYMGIGLGNSVVQKDFWEYTPDGETGCPAPTGLSVASITKTSATLKWNLFGSAPVVKVRYRIIGSNDEMKRLVSGTDGMVKLYNLQPNTTYEWAVFSVCNKDDKSTWIKGPDFTTSPAFTSISNDAVSDVKVMDKTALQITPNPNRGNFVVQMQLPEKAASTRIALYNSFGQIVWQQHIGNIGGAVKRTIALESKISAGSYTLTIQRSDIKLTQKIMIVK